MNYIAPDGPVYQAGTLSGNPVTLAAGLTTLELVSVPGFFQSLTEKTKTLTGGLQAGANRAGVAFTTNSAGGMLGLFFSEDAEIHSFKQVMDCNQDRFRKFFHGMLEQGIYLAPSAFEAGFVSSAHTAHDIENTLDAAFKVMQNL